MIYTIGKLHEYVPSKPVIESFSLFAGESDVEFDDKIFHQILLGGDQLTIARACGSIDALQDHITWRELLEGLLPVIEDWHAKQCLLKVRIKLCTHIHSVVLSLIPVKVRQVIQLMWTIGQN